MLYTLGLNIESAMTGMYGAENITMHLRGDGLTVNMIEGDVAKDEQHCLQFKISLSNSKLILEMSNYGYDHKDEPTTVEFNVESGDLSRFYKPICCELGLRLEGIVP